MDDELKDPALWVAIKARGMPYTTEYNLIHTMISQLNQEQENKISATDILSIQKVMTNDPIWLIYCSNNTVKENILKHSKIDMENRQYELTDMQKHNVRSFNSSSSLRISIHGIPFSVSDTELETWVDSWATRTSRVMKAKAKTGNDNPNHLLNGNRFCYATSIQKSLPRFSVYPIPDFQDPTQLADIQITVYYEGQTINCKKCLDLDHQIKDCKHNQSNMHNPNLEIFRGEKHPLSNFFPVTLSSEGNTYKTAEHMYQHQKATTMNMPDVAANILQTDKAIDAKNIGDALNQHTDISKWESKKVTIMRSILELKYHSCKEFRDRIQDSGKKLIVEATGHSFWASGLPPRATATQPCDSWPGQNRLGQILMEMRAIKFGSPSSSKSVPASNQPEAFQVVQALLTKALNPEDALEISSPELMMQADSVINAAQATQRIKRKSKSLFKLKSPSPKHNKRKDISPVSDNEQPDNKRPSNDKRKLLTLQRYFTKKSQATGTTFEPP